MLILTRYLHEAVHLHFNVVRHYTQHTNAAIRFSSQTSIITITLYGKSVDNLEVEFESFI